jgi:hypothetical protein
VPGSGFIRASFQANAGGVELIGGVAGTAFALQNRKCMAAHHVLILGKRPRPR